MNPETYIAHRLTRLSSKARAVTVELEATPPEKRSKFKRIAAGAAMAGLIGAGGYGAATYARGRGLPTTPTAGPLPRGFTDHLNIFKAGNAANMADAASFMRASGARMNATGRQLGAKSAEYRRRLAAKIAAFRNTAAEHAATTPIKPV